MKITLASPESLNVKSDTGEIYTGGSQEWYADNWHRKAGCGPTVASNLVWYIYRTSPGLKSLPEFISCTRENGGQNSFIKLMEEMIAFITPGLQGVNTSALFYEGFIRYGEKHGVKFTPHILEIPCKTSKRPEPDAVCEFIAAALRADSPVAFLNLSNGVLKNLENWHWVTIIALEAFESGTMSADVCDQGDILSIDLAEWLKTTILGGAMVYMTLSD